MVVTAPQSGDVIAIVGGRDVGYDGFDRALDAHRPMGSLVKPFIYLTALESGRYNAATVVQDAPVDVKLADGPALAAGELHAPDLRRGAGGARARRIAEPRHRGRRPRHRAAEDRATLQRFGLPQPPAQVPAMLLGAVDVTPLETAQLFNGLANGGFRTPLRAVRAVISAQGKPLKAFPLEVTQVAAPETIYQLDRMLVLVMDHGTGRAARAMLPPQLLVAGKSGTSSDLRDSWFAGFSGSDLVVVWVGYDNDDPTGLTGSTGALPVWAHIMAQLNATSWTAPMPESLAEVHIEFPTGLRVVPGCAQDIVAVVVPGGAQLPARPGCGFPDTPPALPPRFASAARAAVAARRWCTDAPARAGRLPWRTAVRLRPAAAARPGRTPRAGAPGRAQPAPGTPAPRGSAPERRPRRRGSFTWEPPRARSSRRRTTRPSGATTARRPPRSSAPCASSPTIRWYGSSSGGCAWRKTMARRRTPWAARRWRSPPATPPRRAPPGA